MSSSVDAIRELLRSPLQLSEPIPISAQAMAVLPQALRASYVVRDGAAAATWLSHLLYLTWSGAPFAEVGEGEPMLHAQLDISAMNLLRSTFDDGRYNITIRRDRRTPSTMKNTRRDEFVEILITGRPYTTLQVEEKTRDAFVEGDNKLDPTRRLIIHTPWLSWTSVYGATPFTLGVVSIGDRNSIDVHFGSLVRPGPTDNEGSFEGLQDPVNVMSLDGRLDVFHTTLKLLPYMRWLAESANRAGSVSLSWSRENRRRGLYDVSLNVVPQNGTLTVVKRWKVTASTDPMDLTASTFFVNLQRIYQTMRPHDESSQLFQKLVGTEFLNMQRPAFYFTPFGKTATPSLVALRHVVEAVAHLHSIGIVHRDLRWPNVVFNDANQRFILIDFDDAVILTPEHPQAPAVTDDQLGRENHSPACFAGPHGREVDIWSIGHLCDDLVPHLQVTQRNAVQLAAEELKANAATISAQNILQSPLFLA